MTYHTDRLGRAVRGAVTVPGKGRLLSCLLSSCGPCFLSISPLAPSLPLVLSCPVLVLQRQTEHPQHTGPSRSHVPRARRGKGSWRLVVAAGGPGSGPRESVFTVQGGGGVRPPQCPLAWPPGSAPSGSGSGIWVSQSWFPMSRPCVHKNRQEVARSMFPTICVLEDSMNRNQTEQC